MLAPRICNVDGDDDDDASACGAVLGSVLLECHSDFMVGGISPKLPRTNCRFVRSVSVTVVSITYLSVCDVQLLDTSSFLVLRFTGVSQVLVSGMC